MASIDEDVVKHMLQVIEHLVDTSDRVSVAARQLLEAQKPGGKALAPATLAHYEQQLQELARLRDQMREVVGRWWTQIEERH